MQAPAARTQEMTRGLQAHGSILWALMMRELATRYGRYNIGFLWVIAEPLLFCVAVLGLWTLIKPPYEHGIRLAPFVVTGYMPILLVRHMVNQAMTCVRANASLLYHRQITVLHLFLSRMGVEFAGVSFAFIVVVTVLGVFGQMRAPEKLWMIYLGWGLLAWIALGLSLIVGAAAELVSVIERFVSTLTYVLVPLSGTFYMVAWVAPDYRRYVLLLPFIHPVEMIRGGFFGDAAPVFYDIPYTCAWAAAFTVLGLLMLRHVRDRVEVD